MATELEAFKRDVENGEGTYAALENVDLDQMRLEGNSDIADKIEQAMKLIDEVHAAAGVHQDA